MASHDALQLLRASIAASQSPFLTKTDDASSAEAERTDSWVDASHVYFPYPTPLCLPLSTPTRFVAQQPEQTQVDLRSAFFAWTQKEKTVPEYIANATELDKQLPEGQKIRNLVFVERLDLLTWLEGATEDSEYITPLQGAAGDAAAGAAAGAVGAGDAAAAAAAASAAANKAVHVAGGASGGVPVVSGTGVGVTQHSTGGRPVKVIDARLQAIYNGERKMGDHNSVLRGTKPTDFSYLNAKCADIFGIRKSSSHHHKSAYGGRPGHNGHPLPARPVPLPSKPSSGTGSAKRSDPIILLSPSASSLIRMTNIRSFLEDGIYVPADHPELASSLVSNVLHITRAMPSLSSKPFRFILVDTPEQFKPDYWNRVVAVFTTGQKWQFSQYKWQEPRELFGHVLGLFVGERGQPVPAEVKGWGSAVKCFAVERWNERSHGAAVSTEVRSKERWKDREVVEELWRGIEGYMKSKGEWRR